MTTMRTTPMKKAKAKDEYLLFLMCGKRATCTCGVRCVEISDGFFCNLLLKKGISLYLSV